MATKKRATKKSSTKKSATRKRATKKRATKKKSAKRSPQKLLGIIPPPEPFITCVDQCYVNLKKCLERNPANAIMCLNKFTACVVGCIGPVFRP